LVDAGSPDADGWVNMVCPTSPDHVIKARRLVSPECYPAVVEDDGDVRLRGDAITATVAFDPWEVWADLHEARKQNETLRAEISQLEADRDAIATALGKTEQAHADTVRPLEQGIGHVDDLERAAGTSEVNREYRLSLERKVVELAEQVEALGRERDSIDAHYQATLRSQARVATRLRDLIAFEHAVLHYRDAIDANTYDGRDMSLEPMAVQVERIEMLNRLRAAEDDVIRIARARRENPGAPEPADESEGT
jgi:outer membrane murein-binding lipoprotein Lpp